jgi:hypothetical protein
VPSETVRCRRVPCQYGTAEHKRSTNGRRAASDGTSRGSLPWTAQLGSAQRGNERVIPVVVAFNPCTFSVRATGVALGESLLVASCGSDQGLRLRKWVSL